MYYVRRKADGRIVRVAFRTYEAAEYWVNLTKPDAYEIFFRVTLTKS